jgi:hypothetical protein
MTIGLAFWILMLLCLFVWGGARYGGPQFAQYEWGGSLLLFVLLAFLGWHAFGPPLHQ